MWLCCIGCWLWNSDVASDEQLEQKNIFSAWRWKTKVKKYFNFWLYACVLFYESLVVSSRTTWRLAFWVLWRLACCSQNTVAKAQRPIVTSHCLHMPLSWKRQCSVYRSPLNSIWHYKHVCVSAYMWRHKLEATLGWIYIDWHHIYQKDDGANAKHESCRRLCDQQITMGRVFSAHYRNLTLHFPSVSRRFKSWDMHCLNEFLE